MNKKIPIKKVVHKKKNAPQEAEKKKSRTSRINKTLLTIIITTIVVFLIMNISTIINTLYTSKKDIDAPSQESSATDSTQINIPSDTQASDTQKDDSTAGAQDSISNPKEANKDEGSDADEQAKPNNTSISTLTLYFVQVADDGTTTLVSVKKEVPKTTAILRNTINELLNGPQNTGALELVSYIPKMSKVKKISISKGVAYLDFNEEFQFNEYGSAGILAQLFQIVYTCTAIPNITAVKITINSNTVKYLGGEGTIEVSEPLTRAYLDGF